MSSKAKLAWVLIFGFVLALCAGSAAAIALAGDGDDEIHACLNPAGQIRIVDSIDECKKQETALTWNQQGPPGPQGEPGPQGDQGLRASPLSSASAAPPLTAQKLSATSPR